MSNTPPQRVGHHVTPFAEGKGRASLRPHLTGKPLDHGRRG
jgi:hypothetical protein